MKILIIDDDQEYIDQLMRLSEKLGVEVEIIPGKSERVSEAIGYVYENDPDVILLDSYFDDLLVGPEIARELKDEFNFDGLVVSYSTASRKDQTKAYKDYPIVKHFVRKSPFELKHCLNGTCDCEKLQKEV